jgi:predicted nucleotidyltransferase
MEDAPVLLGPDLDRDTLLARLKALRPAFVREGITRMWLIGSRARGDNRPDSDIDLMVEIDETRKFSLIELVGVKHIVEDDVGIETDIIMRRSAKPTFLEWAHRDAIGIF